MSHLAIGTNVKLHPSGLHGVIESRNGEYYNVYIASGGYVTEVYLSEMTPVEEVGYTDDEEDRYDPYDSFKDLIDSATKAFAWEHDDGR